MQKSQHSLKLPPGILRVSRDPLKSIRTIQICIFVVFATASLSGCWQTPCCSYFLCKCSFTAGHLASSQGTFNFLLLCIGSKTVLRAALGTMRGHLFPPIILIFHVLHSGTSAKSSYSILVTFTNKQTKTLSLSAHITVFPV